MAKKKMIQDFYRMKKEGEKVTWLTCYDFPTAQFEEAAGIEMILVGDSMGMCVYGYESTVPVTMDQCIVHCEAVRRGAPNTFVIGDMPFMSYQKSDEDAVVNAGRFLKESGMDAIKLEGGTRVSPALRPSWMQELLSAGTSVLHPKAPANWVGTRPRVVPWSRHSLLSRTPWPSRKQELNCCCWRLYLPR